MACIYSDEEFVKILLCHRLSKIPKTGAVRKSTFSFCSPASREPAHADG